MKEFQNNKDDFTEEEKEFIVNQLKSGKDYFNMEMKKGVSSQERLNWICFAMNTIDKAIDHFLK